MALEAHMKSLHLFWAFLAGTLTVAATTVLTAPQTTHACTIDGQPTAFANGSRAVLSHVTFTLKTARTWAPFSFPSRYHARTPIRFTEDRGQLRHALPPDSLRHTVRWDFGDGTHAFGWAVTHRYAHAGIYRVTVQAYYSTWHRYFPFDNVRISIAR
jgi:PKD domain